jgi:ribosomal protein S27AE
MADDVHKRDGDGTRLADLCDTQGVPYEQRTCARCGSVIAAPTSRIGWVFRMHADRCETATDAQRLVFRRTRRWPRKASSIAR